jgi:hypothetical protein
MCRGSSICGRQAKEGQSVVMISQLSVFVLARTRGEVMSGKKIETADKRRRLAERWKGRRTSGKGGLKMEM